MLCTILVEKNFNKDDTVFDICFKILADIIESGKMFVIWVENVKFRVYTNLFQHQAKTVFDRERPKNRYGHIDLNKHKAIFSF